jgi:hypothetical protein
MQKVACLRLWILTQNLTNVSLDDSASNGSGGSDSGHATASATNASGNNSSTGSMETMTAQALALSCMQQFVTIWCKAR